MGGRAPVHVPPRRRRLTRLLGRRRPQGWAVALLVGAQLGVAVAGGLATRGDLDHWPGGQVVASQDYLHGAGTASPAEQVRLLLDQRGRAVLHHDRAAFLATVAPAHAPLVAAETAWFDRVAELPLRTWSYALGDVPAPAGDSWSPPVTLSYALAGFDGAATEDPQQLTFLRSQDRWYVGADGGPQGHPVVREIWDGGPVRAVRGRHSLVLGHPGGTVDLATMAAEADRAVSGVRVVWGDGWARAVVVIVPRDTGELRELLGAGQDLNRLAAVATARLQGPTGGYRPVGDRVVVNPAAFTVLSALGRQVVLRHEVTHVASRLATGPALPSWLVEGLADYAAYLGTGLSGGDIASELREEVRTGRVPSALPRDGEFTGANPRVAQVYEESWLAVRLLAQRFGRPAMLRVYRELGAYRGPRDGAGFDRVLRAVAGEGSTSFVRMWVADVRGGRW